jgi:hypothetical protein
MAKKIKQEAAPVSVKKNSKITTVTLTTGNTVSGKFVTRLGKKFFESGDTYYYLSAVKHIHEK